MAPGLEDAHLLRSRPPSSVIGADRTAGRRVETGPGWRLLCRACDEPVTDDGERIAVAGSHRHRRSNPSRHRFEFGCFRCAPGALANGVPSDEHSWFAGYRWSFSLCRGCAEQLGWLFQGSGPEFHALILDRLRSEDPRGG